MVNALAANITLSTTEQELFGLLKQVLITENLPDTQLRCAGGWVRDKLLGKQSIDIDIALNNLYGEEFAGHVNAYLQASSQQINKVCPALLCACQDSGIRRFLYCYSLCTTCTPHSALNGMLSRHVTRGKAPLHIRL